MTYENLKEKSTEAFKRYTGVKPETFETMIEVLRKAERNKKKPGRSSTLSLKDQLLLTLSYWREYRTQFHKVPGAAGIAASYGVHESTANRIITKVEDVLAASGRFALPKKQAPQAAEHELVVVVVDSTETPIERPKKSSAATIAASWTKRHLPGLSARKSATR
jgi:hypothetical protein